MKSFLFSTLFLITILNSYAQELTRIKNDLTDVKSNIRKDLVKNKSLSNKTNTFF